MLVARAYVLSHEHLIPGEVLENHSDTLAQRRLVPLRQIASVEKNVAGGRLIEPSQEFDQSRLAGAVLADQRQARARPQVQTDMLERRRVRTRIHEAHVLEPDAVLRIGTVGRRSERRGHFGFQVLVERRQIKVVLIHSADRGEHGAYGRLPLTEQHQVHSHLTETDRALHGADRDPRIGAVERAGPYQSQPESPGVPAYRQRAVFLI